MLNGVIRTVAAACLMAAVTHRPPAWAQSPVNPQAAAVKEFGDRVKAYVALHDKVDGDLPRPSDTAPAEAMATHRDALAAALSTARRNAREGDVFFPEVATQFRTIIRADLKARDFRDAIAAVEEVPYRSVWVNMPWPADAPRPTIPAQLLAKLYPLPEDLEYRLLDRHLVLLDVDAQLVVDLVRDVVPSSIKPRIKK